MTAKIINKSVKDLNLIRGQPNQRYRQDHSLKADAQNFNLKTTQIWDSAKLAKLWGQTIKGNINIEPSI